MRASILALTFACACLTVGTPAQSAMQRIDKPELTALTEAVTCYGNRRNYRNFNHCISRRNSARYCSNICVGPAIDWALHF